MLTALLFLTTVTLLAALASLGRLHLLSRDTHALRDAVLGGQQGEVNYLRRQVETLQQQVLALTDPGAQARLHVQGQPLSQPSQSRPLRAAPFEPSTRNPMIMDIPPGLREALKDPAAFEVMGRD